MRRRRPATAALTGALLAVLLAGCGLPIEAGVHEPGPVAADQVEPGPIQVLPPGPRPDAGAREIVLGFLGAQSNPDDGHAIARQFLGPQVRDSWADGGAVVVFDPGSLRVEVDPVDDLAVLVRASVLARIAADGSYQAVLDPAQLEETYRLRKDEVGQLRLAEVPPGLRLTTADAARSFRPHDVYYLASSEPQSTGARLVPDRVFLPAVADPAGSLVRRLLVGPSDPLRGAVATALPAGGTLVRPVTSVDGVVTVDLSAPVEALDPRQRQRLSAQLVWTLRGAGPAFGALRLLVEGRPLEVPGVGPMQDRTAWSSYSPDGLLARTSAVFVQDRRLRSVDGSLAAGEASDGRLPVDTVAVSPDSGQLALVSHTPSGDELRTGPSAGPFPAPILVRPALNSLSWGGGDQGLWAVEPGADPQVTIVRNASPRQVLSVPYTRPPGAGGLSVLKVSRDGARVAATFGEAGARGLYIGRVEWSPVGPQILGWRAVARSLGDVSDVAWETGTSVVVLAPLTTTSRLPVRVEIDGSQIEPVRALGLDGEPVSLAAAPGQPLVVATVLRGKPVVLVEDGGLFRLQPGTGAAPAYPG